MQRAKAYSMYCQLYGYTFNTPFLSASSSLPFTISYKAKRMHLMHLSDNFWIPFDHFTKPYATSADALCNIKYLTNKNSTTELSWLYVSVQHTKIVKICHKPLLSQHNVTHKRG